MSSLTFTPALSAKILGSNNDEADDEAREDEDGHEIHDVSVSVGLLLGRAGLSSQSTNKMR